MKIIIREKTISIILLAFFCFFVIFTPPLINGVPMGYLVMLLMLIYIGYNLLLYGNKYTIKKSSLHFFYGFLPFFIYASICLAFRLMVSHSQNEISAYLINFRKVLASVVYLTLTYLFFKFYLERNNVFTKIDFIKIITVMGLLQTFLIFLSSINDSIQAAFVDLYLKNSGSDIMAEILQNQNNYKRLVGLSSVPFDALSYLIAGIGLVVFAAGLYYSKRFFLFSSFLIIAASTMAARTGLLLFLIGITIISIGYAKKRGKINFRVIIKSFFVFIIFASLVFGYYVNMPDERKKSFENGLYSLNVLMTSGETHGVFNQILFADIVLPDDILFGIGARPETLGYLDKTGGYIDNGYIQLIWRFGLLGLFLLMFGHFYYYRKIYKQCEEPFVRSLVIALAASTFLYYIKQYPLSMYGTNVVYLIVPLVLSVCKEFNKDNREKKFPEGLYWSIYVLNFLENTALKELTFFQKVLL